MHTPVDIAILYAPPDDLFLRELDAHLAPLRDQGIVHTWHPGVVAPGSEPNEERAAALSRARIIVLLVSADFIASEDIDGALVRRTRLRAERPSPRIVAIMVRSCLLEGSLLKELQILPRNGIAVEAFERRDEAWADVAREIRGIAVRLRAELPNQGTSVKRGRSPRAEGDSRGPFVELEAARARVEALKMVGASAVEAEKEVLDLRRTLRDGAPLRPGDCLGQRYVLVRMLGRGGFATVWAAVDRKRNATVAIKVLHGQLAGDIVRRERFYRGARKMADLEHPAIVRIFDASGEDSGHAFMVMEFVEGDDLRASVLNGRTDRAAILPIILEVGEALAFAHARGLVHRDVKPANILLRASGSALLTDFDLVACDTTTGGTRTGAMGTFLYAAPELMTRPQEAGVPADVYGLAMTAVFGLYGRDLPPDVLRNSARFIDALEAGESVKTVLKRAITWEEGRRFRDMSAFCEALRVASEAEGPAAVPESREDVLIWIATKEEGAQTYWLQRYGSEWRLAGRRRGRLLANGERLWEWRDAKRPIRLLNLEDIGELWRSESPDMANIRRVDATIVDAYLVDVLTEATIPMAAGVDDLFDMMFFELSRSIVPLASVGPYLFVYQSDYYFGGGAHGNHRGQFRVLDLNDLTFTDVVSEEERERIVSREKLRAVQYFIEEQREMVSDEDALNAELTMMLPAYDGEGKLTLQYQFTASTCFAASDFVWHGYTMSFRVDAEELPGKLQPYAKPPVHTSDLWRSFYRPGAATGWSYVRSPRAVAWLHGAFDVEELE